MKVALCFSGQTRTLPLLIDQHKKFINQLKQAFDTIVVGYTEEFSTYPNNTDVLDLGTKWYETGEKTCNDSLNSLEMDNVAIDDGSEFLSFLQENDISEKYANRVAQYWKHKKASELAPDCDIYVRARWDVRNDHASQQVIKNIHAMMNKTKYCLPLNAETLVTGMNFHSTKGIMFLDYANTISTNKGQTYFNQNLPKTLKNHTLTLFEHFSYSRCWIDAYVSNENNIQLASAPFNDYSLYEIQRPEWHDRQSAPETW